MVLCARPGVGAVTLALLFGLFNLIYGTWMLAGGIELRRTGKTLRPVPSLEGRKSNPRAVLATAPSQILRRKFDQAVADFAETYAGQAERDHTALADAVASGRVQAQAGI